MDPHLEYLKKKGKLVEVNMTEEEIAKVMRRTGGDLICGVCGKKYYDHPYVSEVRDQDNHPYLNITCDGQIVKL